MLASRPQSAPLEALREAFRCAGMETSHGCCCRTSRRVQVVELGRVACLSVGRPNVIALQKAFDEYFPVDCHFLFSGSEQPLAWRDQLGKLIQNRLSQPWLLLRDEHDAVQLDGL